MNTQPTASLPIDPDAAVTVPQLQELDLTARRTWEELEDVLEAKRALIKREIELKDELRKYLPRGAFAVGGKKVFDILPTRRWDEEQARRVLPQDIAAMLTVDTIDRERAEKLLSPVWYRNCQIEVGRDSIRPVSRAVLDGEHAVGSRGEEGVE
jgi:hypothetical protein